MSPSLFGPYAAGMTATPSGTYRIEHRERGRVTLIAQVTGVPPHFRSLDLYVSRLLQQGAHGELRMVDTTTGAIVARRQIRPFKRSS
jgi:hypothetical protein